MGGAPDGGVSRWVLGLVGAGLARLVQKIPEKEAPPGLPNEGYEPMERGSVERMIEMIEQSMVMLLLLVMMISSDCAGRAGRQPGWLAGMGMEFLEEVLYLMYMYRLDCAVLPCDGEGRAA